MGSILHSIDVIKKIAQQNFVLKKFPAIVIAGKM